MKTIVQQKQYTITEEDESGLIPKEAVTAIVDYQDGKPLTVFFGPTLPPYGSPEREKFKLDEVCERLNPHRTSEQVIQIVNRLESSLTE